MKNWLIMCRLYLRDFFKIKKDANKNGLRRLVQNPKTKKWNWSEGKEPDFGSNSNIKGDDILNKSRAVGYVGKFEPKLDCRFKVVFPNISENNFKEYNYYGGFSSRKLKNGKFKVRELSSVEIYLPAIAKGVGNESVLLSMQKLNNFGDVTVKVLDPIGSNLNTISLSNCKIESLRMFEKLSYESQKPLTAIVEFSHDPRQIK